MATRTRRDIVKKPLVASNGVELETLYCRKCCQQKNPRDFMTTSDPFLDSSGKMSVCKPCVNEMYQLVYTSERSVEKTILRMCRMLNVRFDEPALAATLVQMETASQKGRDIKNVFGVYKAKVNAPALHGGCQNDPWLESDTTFREPGITFISNPLPEDDEETFDLEQFWGTNFSADDYAFLEKELDDWKKTHKSDTKAEIMLLKELCHKSLMIRKERALERPTASLIKELQELMKTANVDPAKASAATAGKTHDTYSSFIKTIEENEPADYYKDKDLFKDFDGIDWYFKKYITRPLKNFITGSRDFSVERDDEEDDDDFNMEDLINGIGE